MDEISAKTDEIDQIQSDLAIKTDEIDQLSQKLDRKNVQLDQQSDENYQKLIEVVSEIHDEVSDFSTFYSAGLFVGSMLLVSILLVLFMEVLHA